MNKFVSNLRNIIISHPIYTFFYLTAFSLWTSIILFGSKFYADERYHYRQIGLFWKGRYEIIGMLTTIPGYHAVIALFAKVSPDLSVMQVRFISFAFSLLGLFIFYLIAKKHTQSKDAMRKTLQFAFLPISFIYFPLVYTDLFSALLILSSLYLLTNKRYHLAAVFSILSILSRQNNIVWLVFLWLYSYVSVHDFKLSIETIKQHIKKTFLFPIGIIAFGIFVLMNGSIAIGDKNSHQAGFYLGNIYFFLAITGILFLPILISQINKKLFISKKFLLFGLGVGAIIAISFLLFPPILHGYNFDNRFLRNIILISIYQKYSWIYAIAIFLGYISLFKIELKRNLYIIYPFAFLYLLPSWLIEQRYSIIPLILILLFKQEKGEKIEWINIAYYLALCIGLFYMIMNTKIFF